MIGIVVITQRYSGFYESYVTCNFIVILSSVDSNKFEVTALFYDPGIKLELL